MRNTELNTQLLYSFVAVGVYRLFTFLVAAISPWFLEYKPSYPYSELLLNFNLPAWIYSFAGFDGVHYITIAEQGYKAAGLIQAFFPIWPLILQVGANFNTIAWGLIVNFIAMVALLIVWNIFIKQIYPELHEKSKIPYLPTLLLLSFPTSFFFVSLYSETIFLLLIISAFVAAHYKKWWLATLLTAIASGTRIVGIVLVPALMIEYWWQQHPNQNLEMLHPKHILKFLRHHWTKLAMLTVGSFGLLAYMTYLYFEFGDPLLFKTVQSQWGHDRSDSLILYPQVVYRYIKIVLSSFTIGVGWITILTEFIIGLIAPILPLLFFKKIRPSHLFFGFVVTIIPTLTGTFSSLPRYVLIAFPIFLGLAFLLKDRPRMAWLHIVLSTFLLICNTILFTQGYWVG